MLRKSDNVFAAIVSDVDIATSTLPNSGVVVTNANLSAGAVVLVDVGMRRRVIGDIATGDAYRIVQGLGSAKPLMISPVITKGTEKITSQKFVPSVQQVTAVGFNGTTGSLPSANSTDYYLRIRRNDNNGRDNSQPTSQFAGPVKTDATATQEELAFALVKSGIKNFSLEPDQYIKFEALSDEAGAALAGTMANLIWTKGSKVLTGDAENKTVTNVAVGDLIKVASAKTNAVYKVAAVANLGGGAGTTPTITLDHAFQGETATVAKATNYRITEADAAASEMGVKMTGVENAFSVSNWRNYYVNRFTATFSDTSTTVTSLTGAKTGTGMWEQVAMDEYMNWGFEGQGTIGTPPTIRESAVKIPGTGSVTALTAKYSIINIAWTEDVNYLTSNSKAEGNVLIYLNLADSSGSGILDTGTANTGETLAVALGITANTLDEA